MRLAWVRLYEQAEDAGLVCRRCGISRPTLRKWYRRYKQLGIDGLEDLNKKPKHSPNLKVIAELEALVLDVSRGASSEPGESRMSSSAFMVFLYH